MSEDSKIGLVDRALYVGKSVLDVGITAGIGATGGAVTGVALGQASKLFKVSDKALNYELNDMFERVVTAPKKDLPGWVVNNPKLKNFVSHAKKSIKSIARQEKRGESLNELVTTVGSFSSEQLKNKSLQTFINDEFQKRCEAPITDFSAENVAQGIANIRNRITASIQRVNAALLKNKESFINIAKGDSDIVHMATKAAKHFRSKYIFGACIGIGIITALIINLLHTWGVIGKNKEGE